MYICIYIYICMLFIGVSGIRLDLGLGVPGRGSEGRCHWTWHVGFVRTMF